MKPDTSLIMTKVLHELRLCTHTLVLMSKPKIIFLIKICLMHNICLTLGYVFSTFSRKDFDKLFQYSFTLSFYFKS